MDMLPKTFDVRNAHHIMPKTTGIKVVCVPLNKTHKVKKPIKKPPIKEKEKINQHEDEDAKDKDKEDKIEHKSGKNHTTGDKHDGKDKSNNEGKSVAEGGKAILRTGTIARDPIPEDAIKEISVHVKQSHGSMNLTDEAFEAMGDQVPDTLDFAHMQVETGEKAAQVKKEQAHANHSLDHSVINR